MAQQIKKKFIQNDAVDGQKIKLQKDQSVRGQKQDGSEVELLKLDGSDKLVSGGKELSFKEVVDAQVSDLQGKLDSEEASRISGDETLQSNLDSEQSAREQADQDLQSSISSEESRAESEESRIESKVDSMIASEESARESADQGLQSQIDTEKGRVDAILLASDADKDSFAEIVQLINSVDTENDSAFGSYVLSNNSALASEVSARQQGDQDLQSSIDAEETRAIGEESRIESKFDGSMSTEQAARIAGDSAEQSRAMGVESNLQSQITQEVSDRQSAVSSEASALQSADSSLQSSLNSEISARQAADSAASSALAAEQTARIAADADLQSQHDDLDAYAQDVRSDLDDLDGYAQDVRSDLDQEIVDRAAAVSAEASARQSADSSLQSSLSSEISRAQSAESTEQAARIAGDASLQSSLNSEISSRQSADSQLQSNIDSEQAARIAGDSSTLQSSKDYTDGKISLVMSNLDTEALDSLVEVVTAFQNADGSLSDSISSLSSSASSALAAEVARAMSKESELEDSIDSEQSRAMTAESLIQSNLDAAVLQTNIDLNSIHDLIQTNEENNGTAHEDLQSSIEAEQARAEGVEAGLEDSKANRAGDTISGSFIFDDQSGDQTTISPASVLVENPNNGYSASYMGHVVEMVDSTNAQVSLSISSVNFRSSDEMQYSSFSVGQMSMTDDANNMYAEYIGATISLEDSNGSLFVNTGAIQILNSDGEPSMPVESSHLAVKAYVDQQDQALSSRVDAIEAQTDGPYFEKQKFIIDESSELSSVELSHECMENSLVVCVGRLMVHKDEDYSVSVVDGKSVLTWTGDFATGGSEAIEESDVIFVTFAREV